jgi:hypothetical protein
LIARDRAIERWLHTEVTAASDELKADRSKALTMDQVHTSLVAAHRRRATTRE